MEQLPILVGRSKALEIIIGGEDIDAVTAERYGLINRLVPDEKLDQFIYEFALRISRFDPVITRQAKTMINHRSPKASMAQMNDSRAAFIQANLRAERQPITDKLREWGIGQDNNFEHSLGMFLTKL
jgi:enoyl-CoA hydratase/carnithine racemase